MVSLIGYTKCKLDEKSRLVLPSRFLKQLDGDDAMEFVLKPNPDKPCLDLYPKSQWGIISSKLAQLDEFQPEVQDFLIHFLRGHQAVSTDKANRISIDPQLRNEISMGRDVTLVAILNMIQIWDTEAYENFTANKPRNFHEITKQALKNKKE